jgi:hypothetical protein
MYAEKIRINCEKLHLFDVSVWPSRTWTRFDHIIPHANDYMFESRLLCSRPRALSIG